MNLFNRQQQPVKKETNLGGIVVTTVLGLGLTVAGYAAGKTNLGGKLAELGKGFLKKSTETSNTENVTE